MEPELIMSLVLLLIFAAVAWCNRALATGRIGRNPVIGIRTKAVTHCDRCWLLGHHAAAAKTNIGLVVAVVIVAVPSALAVFLTVPGSVLVTSWIAGLAAMLAGLFLGARDAAWVASKIHQFPAQP